MQTAHSLEKTLMLGGIGGRQLIATHMQREARGEQGQRGGLGAAEGPGRRLAHGQTLKCFSL